MMGALARDFMTSLSKLRLHVLMVLATLIVFTTMVGVNELLFKAGEFVPGINWVYLPAGVRLVATLLFGFSGAIGLLLAGWLVNFYWLFPDDFARAFMGGIIAAVAPYGVYVMARYFFGLQSNLSNLSSGRLLVCIMVYALANPLLHQLWFGLSGWPAHGWYGMAAMIVGDFLGSIVVFYALKLALDRWMPVKPPQPLQSR